MKIISFASRKGGFGKTTITYLISTYLSEIKNKRILLIDADPQGNLSSMFDLYENNTAILFSKNKLNLFKIIKKTSIKNLEIISSNIDLDDSRLNENEIKLNFNKEKLLLKNNKNKEQSGGLKTFYLHSSHIKKLNQWNKQGYSNSKIIQMLIDNAPEKF